MGFKLIVFFKYYISLFKSPPPFNLTSNTTWFFSLNNEILFWSADQVPFLLIIPERLSVVPIPAVGGITVVV